MAEMTGIEFEIKASTSKAKDSVQSLTNALKKLKTSLSGTSADKVSNNLGKVSISANRAKSSFESIARKSNKASAALANIGAVAKSAASGFKNVATNAVKAAGHLAAVPFKNAASGAKEFAGKLASVANAIKRIIFYRMIRTLVKQIGEAFKYGVNNLYAWSNAVGGTFAASMDRIATSFAYFKNSVGAAVAPLINALAPAIEYVIDKAVALLNIINQLFARLSGATFWTKATKQATSYGGAVDDAAGSAKELAKYLAPFDELNVLPDKTSSSGGGGGGGSDTSGLFEEQMEFSETIQNIAEFFDQVKELINAGEWEELGKLLGEGINSAIDWVPWGEIGERVGTFMNNLFTTAYWTLDTVNFENLGSSISEMINKAIENIDFENLGRLTLKPILSIADIVIGFAEGFDFEQAAQKVSDFISGFVNEAADWIKSKDWEQLKESLKTSLSNAVNGVKVDEIKSAFDNLVSSLFGTSNPDWEQKAAELGQGLGNLVNKAVDLIPWGDIGSAVGVAINSLFSFTHWTLKTINFENIGAKVAELLNHAIETINFEEIGATLIRVLTSAVDFVVGLVDGLHWDSVASAISHAITGAIGELTDWFDEKDWISFGNNIYTSIKDFFNGIEWASIAQKIAELTGSVITAVIKVVVGFAEGTWDDLKTEWNKRMTEYNNSVFKVALSFEFDALTLPGKIEDWVKQNITDPIKNKVAEGFGVDEDSPGWQFFSSFIDGMQNALKWYSGPLGQGSFVYDNFIKPLFKMDTTDDPFADWYNWFVTKWNALIDKIKQNSAVVNVLDFLGINVDSLKLDPINVTVKATSLDTSGIPESQKKVDVKVTYKTDGSWAGFGVDGSTSGTGSKFTVDVEPNFIWSSSGSLANYLKQQGGLIGSVDLPTGPQLTWSGSIASTLTAGQIGKASVPTGFSTTWSGSVASNLTSNQIGKASMPLTWTRGWTNPNQTIAEDTKTTKWLGKASMPLTWDRGWKNPSYTIASDTKKTGWLGTAYMPLTWDRAWKNPSHTIASDTKMTGWLGTAYMPLTWSRGWTNSNLTIGGDVYQTGALGSANLPVGMYLTDGAWTYSSIGDWASWRVGSVTLPVYPSYASGTGLQPYTSKTLANNTNSYVSGIMDNITSIVTTGKSVSKSTPSGGSGSTTKPGTKNLSGTKALGGIFAGGAWHDIQAYASGLQLGYPGPGQMFVAREAGPELVGTLGGHTAVMNNDQIVASVSAGVARAISNIEFHMEGLGSYMMAAAGGGSELDEDAMYRAFKRALDETDFEPEIQLDGETLYRSMVNRNRRNTRMTGANAMA